MTNQLITAKTNMGTLTLEFGWENNIAMYSDLKINGIPAIDHPILANAEEIITYHMGEGETPRVGTRYEFAEELPPAKYPHWGRDWTLPHMDCNDQERTGRTLSIVVTSVSYS